MANLPFGQELNPGDIQGLFGVNPNDTRSFSQAAGGDVQIQSTPGGKKVVTFAGGGGNGINNGVSDPVSTARQLQQFTVQANQPAISTLQGQVDPLKQRYSDLIDSIKGAGTVASNYAQQSASMDLGRRGLLPQSQEGQQALSNALLPAQAQTQSQLSQTGLAENQDLNTINNAIAALQTGNPESSITNALQLTGLQQQQLQFGSQLGLTQQAQAFQQRYITVPNVGVYDTQSKQFVGQDALSLVQTVNGKPMINI